MPTPAEQTVAALDTYLREVIAPAAVVARRPLAIAAHQSIEPIPAVAAMSVKYRTVRPGWLWGPKWSTCWFRLSAKLDAAARRRPLHLRFSTDTEALLWHDGVPYQGLDVNRELARLPAPAITRDGRVELYVEAACNHPFGAVGLQWDIPETIRRWESATPGRLLVAELVELDDAVDELARSFAFALGLMRELIPPSPPMFTPLQPWLANPPLWQSARAEQLGQALRRVMRLCRPGSVVSSAAESISILRGVLAQPAAASTPVGHAVGHAHIDTAWLWPLRETRRKCLRTFSSVLRLMERDPSFVFLCSQAQQYAYVEEDSPALFRQIKARVAEGRWEPGGAMWIEPDANVPSGESLVRQLLHGSRYWLNQFGPRAKQRFLFLPDTFGFPAQLPQLMRLAGLDTFITNKLSWHDTNPYPHTTFLWRGLDGSEVVAHQTPAHDYNAANTPREFIRAERNHRSKQLIAPPPARGSHTGPRFLHPFGFGDGGGGPTEAMTHAVQLAADCDGLPRMRFSRTDEFCAALHADLSAARRAGSEIPEHQGELYLELHRGTLTTHARLKQANREAEDLLRLAELLIAGSPAPWPAAQLKQAKAMLDRAWKLLLLNQFHDILPGSSITWVYDDARRDHASIRALVQPIVDEGLARWSQAVATHEFRDPVLVLNPGSFRARGLSADGSTWLDDHAPLTLSAASAAASPPDDYHATIRANQSARHATLDNGIVRAEIDALGQITSLRSADDQSPRAELAPQPLNQLATYEDRPSLWDAWDIDRLHAELATIEARPATRWRVIAKGPLRAAVEITRPLGQSSTITQTVSLAAEALRLDIHTRIDWREEKRLLRALFPTDLRCEHADFQTQFGYIRRPTGPGHSAQFEVPMHRWMKLAEPDRGLAVLNQHQFGGFVRGSTLALSLLRSPIYPDPTADRGKHEFTYSLLPNPQRHAEEFEAESLVRPCLISRPAATKPTARGDNRPTSYSPFTLEGHPVQIAAFKPAEDGTDLILRLVEVRGVRGSTTIHWNLPTRSAIAVDLLERPLKPAAIDHQLRHATTQVHLEPFQIITLRITRA